ncbi:uncharacterized protein LOC119767636 isoform X2 [Culex quinquefasciatus]|uniref:uncharacterized protein LOC119767636 isoform X2 n=1 Tax=Culex quinquefasciatus TaxID=7176 RepID=UPI0018E2DD5E|nr:uncharacterized protein LOC119767636 isoform X2 [Culex quinquefasciatus]XP_038112555.1 uncharacterized protein LOC119767636 isoform X2 [Culex quinquefasciatus]
MEGVRLEKASVLRKISCRLCLTVPLLIEIFKQLPISTLIQATSVCHRWNQIIFSIIHKRIRCRISNDLDLVGQNSLSRSYGAITVDCSTLSLATPTLLQLCRRATELEIHANLLHESVLAELLPQCPRLERLTVRAKCLVVEGAWKTVELRGRFPTIESVSVIAESFFSPGQRRVPAAGGSVKSRKSRVKSAIANGVFCCWKKLRKLVT